MNRIVRIVLVLAVLALAACQAHSQAAPPSPGDAPRVRTSVPPRPSEGTRVVCLDVVEIQYLFPRDWFRFDRPPCMPYWMRLALHERREAEIMETALLRRTA